MKEKWPVWMFYAQMILGIWLIASPDTFGYKSPILWWSDVLCGAALIILGWLGRRNPLWNIPILFIGIWLEAAPLLFWAPSGGCYLNNTLIGAAIITLSFVVVPTPGQLPDEGPEVPPGWSYNPSSWPQRLPIALLAFLCWMISRYLAAYQLGYIDTIWDPFFGNGTKDVLTSTVSKAFPVSDAGLGALAYTFEFLSTIQGGTRRWRTSPWMVMIFGILVIPVSLTSVILIILQPLAVGHWCFWCLVTAALMLIGIPFAIDEVVLVFQYLRRSRRSFWPLFFKGGECPKTTEDRRSPPLDAPLPVLWRASLWGMTMPWNLLLSIPIGLLLMILPKLMGIQGWLLDLDLILGAFAIVIAVVSLAEHTRAFRWVNLFFGALLLAASFLVPPGGSALAIQIACPLLLCLLSLRRGSIREKTSLTII
jgi:uncharacterized membrane protein